MKWGKYAKIRVKMLKKQTLTLGDPLAESLPSKLFRGGGGGGGQNGNFCLYFENSRKGPIFKASNEIYKEDFNRHQFFSQYVNIKLMQNETNRWSIFW